MMQTIDGKRVYVVEFDTMPELPITGLIEEEQAYESALSFARGFWDKTLDKLYRRTGDYAYALNQAIETGVITEPGKYAIHIAAGRWNVFKVIEE